MDLDGRVALVTGSARRVGRATALALAQRGAHVVIHFGGSADEAEQTSAEVESLGVESFAFRADLTRPDEVESLLAAVEDRLGRLDVLVNNAATFRKRSFDKVGIEDWHQVMRVNLRAPYLCSQLGARVMRGVDRDVSESALIVNMADLSGVYAWMGYSVHGISKAGVLHMTKAAARELAPEIRVNAIVPGPILPPTGMDPDGTTWRSIYEFVPLQRAGNPQHIGQTVVFLAENDYITGAAIPVDGGEHLVGPASY
jgi:NAD(P)-dependent dehydrogenase (short-subunit alcohol dehydrogenase family)